MYGNSINIFMEDLSKSSDQISKTNKSIRDMWSIRFRSAWSTSTGSLERISVDVVASVIIGSLTIRSGRTSRSITIEQLTSRAATPCPQ